MLNNNGNVTVSKLKKIHKNTAASFHLISPEPNSKDMRFARCHQLAVKRAEPVTGTVTVRFPFDRPARLTIIDPSAVLPLGDV